MRARWVFFGLAGAVALAGTGSLAATRMQEASPAQPAAGTAQADYTIPDGPWSDNIIEQPIAFRHDLHAGLNQMSCLYCHYSADRSKAAGIPPVQLCAGCHAPAGALLFRQNSPELAKLLNYWNQQQPIPWNRIYKLADHAHFPHMRHVNAGLQCQECHGPVETMQEIVQWPSLRMGWCIECHREREVRIDCAVCHY